jgi:hypothetical protein
MKSRLAVLSIALLFTMAAPATTVVRRSIEDLARDSALIVHGRAGESQARWEGGLLHTYTRIEVKRALKGSPSGSVLVKQPGGETEAYTQKVSGVRHWAPGQEVVLFLRPSAAGDAYVVTGLMQGNFAVRQHEGRKVLSNGVPDADAYEARTGQVSSYRGTELTLEELEQRVRKAVGQ